ncbi:magnesium chelatase [Candidatus Sumerlaeota bacterium]|nr:magnesium chelatase [Candidatus Sumerlaeota bacterium]
MAEQSFPKTFGELKASGYEPIDVKEEMRRNLLKMLREGTHPFTGILGYEESVIPQLENAVLSKHDILLLGLRGQAKTRLARLLVNLLDEYMPAIRGCPLRSSPYQPITKLARQAIAEKGDDAELEWVHRSARYQEKLATPDVSIADLIGDVDPIKAVSRKLDLSDEDVIHYGIILRSNRGIFSINELADLQSRIQVGLLNIMEERDVQIRGFPIRMPLDLAIVFTANPEDYTNRGNIITPLKDRIDAQILTHYPDKLQIGMDITAQEAWVDRKGSTSVVISPLLRELVEMTAVEARRSDYVDKNSGVSARMPISLFETLVSVVERRAVIHGEDKEWGRIHDVFSGVPAISGKVELVYRGEQEGIGNVAFHLLGRAVRSMFNSRFVPNWRHDQETKHEFPEFKPILDWFDQGNGLDLGDALNRKNYIRQLKGVGSLEQTARKIMKNEDPEELPLSMEFILEGLHQNFLLTKRFIGTRVVYTDSLSSMIGD